MARPSTPSLLPVSLGSDAPVPPQSPPVHRIPFSTYAYPTVPHRSSSPLAQKKRCFQDLSCPYVPPFCDWRGGNSSNRRFRVRSSGLRVQAPVSTQVPPLLKGKAFRFDPRPRRLETPLHASLNSLLSSLFFSRVKSFPSGLINPLDRRGQGPFGRVRRRDGEPTRASGPLLGVRVVHCGLEHE